MACTGFVGGAELSIYNVDGDDLGAAGTSSQDGAQPDDSAAEYDNFVAGADTASRCGVKTHCQGLDKGKLLESELT